MSLKNRASLYVLTATSCGFEVQMNVAEIKPSRCSQPSVLRKKGILTPSTGIHLGEKKGGTAHESWKNAWFVLAEAALDHFTLQSGSTLSLSQCNAPAVLPFSPPKTAGQNRPHANGFGLSKLSNVSEKVFNPLASNNYAFLIIILFGDAF